MGVDGADGLPSGTHEIWVPFQHFQPTGPADQVKALRIQCCSGPK